MRKRRGMGAETAQLDAVVTEMMQFVQDLVKIVGWLLLVEDISPATDGEFLFHGCSLSPRAQAATGYCVLTRLYHTEGDGSRLSPVQTQCFAAVARDGGAKG